MAILKPSLPGIMRGSVLGTVEASFTDECTVRRVVKIKDEWGSNEEEIEDVATVGCRVLPDNRRNYGDNSIGGRETGREYVRIILPVGTDVRDNDLLTVNSAVYEILRMAKSQTDALFIDVEAVRIEG